MSVNYLSFYDTFDRFIICFYIYIFIHLFVEVVIHLCLHTLILENKVIKKWEITSHVVYATENQPHNAALCSTSGNSDSKACQQLFTILKIEARSQNITNNKSDAQGYAGARGPESQWAIINAVEHSLSAQSLISAKEEGGTTHRPNPFFAKNSCLDRESITVSTSLRALDQFSHILITMSASNWVLWNGILLTTVIVTVESDLDGFVSRVQQA